MKDYLKAFKKYAKEVGHVQWQNFRAARLGDSQQYRFLLFSEQNRIFKDYRLRVQWRLVVQEYGTLETREYIFRTPHEAKRFAKRIATAPFLRTFKKMWR